MYLKKILIVALEFTNHKQLAMIEGGDLWANHVESNLWIHSSILHFSETHMTLPYLNFSLE